MKAKKVTKRALRSKTISLYVGRREFKEPAARTWRPDDFIVFARRAKAQQTDPSVAYDSLVSGCKDWDGESLYHFCAGEMHRLFKGFVFPRWPELCELRVTVKRAKKR